MTRDLVFVALCGYAAWLVVEWIFGILAVRRWLCRTFDHSWSYEDHEYTRGSISYRVCKRCEPVQRVEMLNGLRWILVIQQ